MAKIFDALPTLITSSPVILSLILAIGAVGIVGFALYIVHQVMKRGSE